MKLKKFFTSLIVLFCLISFVPKTVDAAVDITTFSGNFVRECGRPASETHAFSGVAGQAVVKIWNGTNIDCTNVRFRKLCRLKNFFRKVTSASLYINDNLVFGPRDFNRRKEYLETTVNLNEGNNEITGTLRGIPGESIHVEIVQTAEHPLSGSVFLPDDAPLDIVTIDYQTEEGLVPVEVAAGRVIVQFVTGTPVNIAENLIMNNGGTVIEKIPALGLYVAEVTLGNELFFIGTIVQNQAVESADFDFVLSNSEYSSTPTEGVTNRPYLKQIKAPEAWGALAGQTRNRDITIGVIDSGFVGFPGNNHGDFAGRYELIGEVSEPSGEHGTMVMSIMTAAGNTDDFCGNNICGNIGIDWENLIRISEKPILLTWHLKEKIISQVSAGVKVVNISSQIGGLDQNDGLCDIGETSLAIYYLNKLSANIGDICQSYNYDFIVVNAAGNDGCDLGYVDKPDNLLIVGGSNGIVRDSRSMYGEAIDIAAPYEIQGYYSYARGVTENASGTSVSAPLVAGAAGLIWSYDRDNLTAAQVVERLKATARGHIEDYGGAGVLDIYGALNSDEDDLPNALDNCPEVTNQNQADADGDGYGDVCEESGKTYTVWISVENYGGCSPCLGSVTPTGVVTVNRGENLTLIIDQGTCYGVSYGTDELNYWPREDYWSYGTVSYEIISIPSDLHVNIGLHNCSPF
ncbi:MAG: S8/S53 family peptidase [Candidatus Falkowbacteria bacterium]